jgi:hypothetical protein
MGKSRSTKWYDLEDEDDLSEALHSADQFKEKRAKRLRTITDKHEEVEEHADV